MKRFATLLLSTVVVFTLLSACTPSPEKTVSPALELLRDNGRVLDASIRRDLPSTPNDRAWHKAEPQKITLLPQNAVAPALKDATPLTAEIRAMTANGELALHIHWPDSREDRYSTAHTDRFADALAVQFVVNNGDTLPYIGMGEPHRPVALWYWQAGRAPQALTARGFGTLAPNQGAPLPEVSAEHGPNGWTVVLRGPIPDGVHPLPLAIAVWDGANGERNGLKHLSAWHLLHLPNQVLDEQQLLALVAQSRTDGNPANGARLMQEQGCIACHHLPGQPSPVSQIGPNLSLAGSLHWPGYLRRMIEDPSSFIVPGKGYAIVTPEGHTQSLMPKLQLSPEQIDDLVAFLRNGDR